MPDDRNSDEKGGTIKHNHTITMYPIMAYISPSDLFAQANAKERYYQNISVFEFVLSLRFVIIIAL